MNQPVNVWDDFYLSQFDAMIEAISAWPNADDYIPKLRRLRDNLLEKGRQTYNPDPNNFNTLIHGDLFVYFFSTHPFFRVNFKVFQLNLYSFVFRWLNNIMVRNKTDQNGDTVTENVMLLDYQALCWSSPTVDLHNLLNTSVQESLRFGRFDELIAIYHSHLVDCLTRLDYEKPIPNLDEFKKQYEAKKFHGRDDFVDQSLKHWILLCFCLYFFPAHPGFVMSCLMQPIMLYNQVADDSLAETFFESDERAAKMKQNMYSCATVQAHLRKLIPIYNEMGIFD